MGKIDVIIPSRNDHETAYHIASVFSKHPRIGTVIVAENPTTQLSSWVSHPSMRKDILALSVPFEGKGQVVKYALDYVETDRVIFCDGDLSGFSWQHAQILARPWDGMIVGVPDRPERMPVPWPVPDDVWQVVSGQRAVPTEIVRPLDLHGYCMEVQINQAVRKVGIKTTFKMLHGVVGKVRQNSMRMAELRRDQKWWGEHCTDIWGDEEGTSKANSPS